MAPEKEREPKLNPHYVMRWWMTNLPTDIPAELRLTIHALFAYSNDWFTRLQLKPDANFTAACSHGQIAAYVGKSVSTVKRYLAELRQRRGLLTWEESKSKNEGNVFTVYATAQESLKTEGTNPEKVEQARKAAQVRWERLRQLKSGAEGQLIKEPEVSSNAMRGSAQINAGSAQSDARSAQQVSYSVVSGLSGINKLGKTTVEATTVNVFDPHSVEQNEKSQPTADFCPETTHAEHFPGSDGICSVCGFDNPTLCTDAGCLIVRNFSKLTRVAYTSLLNSNNNRNLAATLLETFTKDEIITVMNCVMTTGYWADKINTFKFFVEKFADKLVPAHAAVERGKKAREQSAKQEGKLGLTYQSDAGKFFEKGNIVHV